MKFWVNLNATFDRDVADDSELLDELQEVVSKMAKARVYFTYKFDEHIPPEEL